MAWDTLLAAQAQPTPFMRHAYLAALHASGCAVASTGWAPRFVTVTRHGALVAAAPAYLKTHSYGEYVFDWAWADAYHRHGLRYYPKLLVAVPFTPVPGSRLLATDAAARGALLQGLQAVAAHEKASGLHVLFHPEAESGAVADAAGLVRQGVQFHWQQQAVAPWPDFEAFLASLAREKRKKIQQERRRVAEAGVTFTAHRGHEISDELWRFFHGCYTGTYRLHHSKPYLNLEFFRAMGRAMPAHWLLFVARRGGDGGTPIAASLVALDEARGAAFGRYWGATEYIPCLHFEACYYQPLAWCLANGYTRFEGGAQGEHKMARGLMPAPTRSAHWLAHPEFNRAVADYLAQEGEGIAAYIDELHEHSPFRHPGA
ncbi:GNAT family N-acetyltransferase [Aquabacterium sp. OR-4]|uniref:GNAT family N-acetyltransferase n=1 Tax=Aquabacterium sp. OR-4 TaxID=2978127 RepID=UPI0021B43FC4|nr:GNAT family N-acetyltransferase [Aquabacterium sp. OR-4]MDT7835262.1 GNAT family N-acetyltransferase [Aquabacterium sp. OR-4]